MLIYSQSKRDASGDDHEEHISDQSCSLLCLVIDLDLQFHVCHLDYFVVFLLVLFLSYVAV